MKLTPKQKQLVKEYVKSVLGKKLNEISYDIDLETLDRMEGLTDQNALNKIESSIYTIVDDLLDEGFEAREIRIYLKSILDKHLIKIK